VTAAAASAAYGRSLAARLGKPAPPDVDWASWGAAAKAQLEKNLPPPAFDAYVFKPADVLPLRAVTSTAMTPAASQAIVMREQRSVDWITPRTAKEVIRLRELGVITRREARLYLGLPVHWWTR